VLVDCEHFFDGYKANPDYALACARAAHESGARWVVLCDTNGGTLPHEIGSVVAAVLAAVPGIALASMLMTIVAVPSPTPSRPSKPAPVISRERSTASASAAATPTS
jgi:hypothetical protein